MSDKRRVLQALRHAGPQGCTGAELDDLVGRRFSARILELRKKDGHEIETVRPTNGGDWRYRLVRDAGYQRAAKATTKGDAPGDSSRPVSDAPASSPSAPALFELPPPAPRSALLEEDQAA